MKRNVTANGWTRARARRTLLIVMLPILCGMLVALIVTDPAVEPIPAAVAGHEEIASADEPTTPAPDREAVPPADEESVSTRGSGDAAAAQPTPSNRAQGSSAPPARAPRMAPTAPVMAQNRPSVTPDDLKAVLGPLALRGSGPAVPAIHAFDERFNRTETDRYRDYLKVEQDRQGAFLQAQHYGGLISRLAWSIRNGDPIGPDAPPEAASAYARGRRIVRRYLEWSKRNDFNIPPHNNTGLADIEALYVLEGDEDALTHIHVTAMGATTDRYGYYKFRNKSSDARQVAVALQAFMAAHRLGIPYERNDANREMGFNPELGSWLDAADRQIGWIRENAVRPDGSIPSPAHERNEAYLFNALLATRLLEWCANIEWDEEVFALAQSIMDHLIASKRPGWPALGYQSNSRQAATDLAAFYVWPSLALWQETGDAKYREFAIQNLNAASRGYIDQMKQWNQTYSTLAQGAEALLAGVSWRPYDELRVRFSPE